MPQHDERQHWPERAIDRWLRPLASFLRIESASGCALLACTLAALALANSPWSGEVARLWHLPLGLSLGRFQLIQPLDWWISDALMTVFFFVVGLEIKRELVSGELREPRKAALPVVAALGGMLLPATIYFLLQQGQPAERGWAIPMATDIAFVVGFLALLGRRVPIGLKILLLSLAIADDIGAVLVIACAYSTDISLTALGLAGLGFAATYLCNRAGVRQVPIYVLLGAGIWLALLHSGIHPTVAGVLLGLLTPASAWVGDATLREVLAALLTRLQHDRDDIEPIHHQSLANVSFAAREAISPLVRLETLLHPWVAFVIMPLFALANAGVAVHPAALAHPVALSVAASLLLGKPLGIVLFCWLATRLGLAQLPTGVTWKIMIGAGFLGGIGFTMSLFIAGLALTHTSLEAAKIGILLGSTLSAAVGSLWLLASLPRPPHPLQTPSRTRPLVAEPS